MYKVYITFFPLSIVYIYKLSRYKVSMYKIATYKFVISFLSV